MSRSGYIERNKRPHRATTVEQAMDHWMLTASTEAHELMGHYQTQFTGLRIVEWSATEQRFVEVKP